MTATSPGVSPERLASFLQPYKELWDYYAFDAWGWVLDCMRTRNEDAAPGQERERLPVPNIPHLEWLTWAWYAVKLLQIDKSRQMMATWMVCGLHVHEAMFVEATNMGYQHMDAGETAKKMDKYMLYVLQAQPIALMMPWVEERDHPPGDWVRLVSAEFGLSMVPEKPPLRTDLPSEFGSAAYEVAKSLCNRYRKSSGAEGVNEVELRPYFSASSRYIYGIPAGAAGPNKWRGDTRTRATEDEAFFHASLADNVNSALQSVGANGRQVLYSTATKGVDGDEYPIQMIEKHDHQPEVFGGFGARLKPTPDGPELVPYTTRNVADLPYGVEMWKTKMGYTHMRIWHYADPKKATPEWVQENVYEKGDVRKNLREILIQYNAPSGTPFYPSFRYNVQRLARRPKEREAGRIVLCMDGGRRPATTALLVYPSGRVIAALELVTPSSGPSSNVTAHATALRRILSADPLFSDWRDDHVLALDPSMFDTRGEVDDQTSADMLQEMGFNVVKGRLNVATRYEAVTNLNLQTIPEDSLPALLVDAVHCPVLYEALSGACTLSKASEKASSYQKTKDGYSHVVDALEYGASFLDVNSGYASEQDDVSEYETMLHRARR